MDEAVCSCIQKFLSGEQEIMNNRDLSQTLNFTGSVLAFGAGIGFFDQVQKF